MTFIKSRGILLKNQLGGGWVFRVMDKWKRGQRDWIDKSSWLCGNDS